MRVPQPLHVLIVHGRRPVPIKVLLRVRGAINVIPVL
jgi:hypothetical protein